MAKATRATATSVVKDESLNLAGCGRQAGTEIYVPERIFQIATRRLQALRLGNAEQARFAADEQLIVDRRRCRIDRFTKLVGGHNLEAL